jgi:hypothetical protein
MAALTMLNLCIPFASAAHESLTGYAVAQMTTLDIEANVPATSRQVTLTIDGRTKPGASVHAFVNDARVSVVTARDDGTFRLLSIPFSEDTNTLRLEAREANKSVHKDYTILVDAKPPKVTLAKEIPNSVTGNTLTVSGDVDEKVTIYYRVIRRAETVPPGIVANVRATKIEPTAVELSWDPSSASDFKEFSIERDGLRIAASTLTSFRDENLKPGTTYTYGVRAVDTSCNIGDFVPTMVTTRQGAVAGTPLVAQQNLSCEPPYKTATAGSPFSITLDLSEGQNEVDILFFDKAGNRAVIRKTVSLDKTAPRFLENNIKDISPSYSPDIRVKGRLSEPGTVFVYLNDAVKPVTFGLTDQDGWYSIPVHLSTATRIKAGAKKAGIEIGEGWVNKLKLEAIDLAGNKASFGPADVDFLLCGQGTWWAANVGEALPSVLLPRLMIQSVQQIGIPFNITYIGPYQVKLGKVDVRPIMLAKEAAKDYDHDWIQVSSYKRSKGPKDTVGYVQIMFQNVDPAPGKGLTPGKKEKALSDHRRGECVSPGLGCVKLFLQMDIDFQEIIPIRPAQPGVLLPSPQIERRLQRVCMPVEVGIDQTIPADIIPTGLLKAAVGILGEAINFIDKVLEPITTIGEYLLYGCLASNIWLYFDYFTEKLACEGSALAATATGAAWNPDVAEAGLCDAVYGQQGGTTSSDSAENQQQNAAKLAACKKCQSKLEARKKFETNVMHSLCDRIGCPNAPTFSSYIKHESGQAKPLEGNKRLTHGDVDKWQVGSKLYVGNDCAFTHRDLPQLITPTYQGTQQLGYTPEEEELSFVPERLGIRDLYDIAKKTKTPPGPTADDCAKPLHPAHPNCCGITYQREWSSACGVGTAVSDQFDLFDELKESTCLAAQQANINAEDLKCNRVWNSIAGFCEKSTGQPKVGAVSLDSYWTAKQGGQTTRPNADGNRAYLFVIPVTPPGSKEVINYKVSLGYADTTPQPTVPQDESNRRGDRYLLSQSRMTATDADVSECFGQKPTVRAEQSKAPARIELEQQVMCVADKICNKEFNGYKLGTCEKSNIRNAVQKVNDIVLTPDEQFIVRPSSGLLRSIQCACIPAVTSYLHMWRKVLGFLHGCFSSILLTGEGSPGLCAAQFSGIVCDLLYEFISCFVHKFNYAGAGTRPSGFGNILGALTNAGTAVSKSVTERYGTTSLYRSLFSERKLVHAMCAWAFTGTWRLDMHSLFQQQVEEMPVDTSGALLTCERTFISYDPTTDPPGLTSWAYRIAGGLITGTDTRYYLKLKCNTDFTCDPRWYRDGKCDCQTGAKEMTVSTPELGRGIAKKFDMINFDAQFVVNPQQLGPEQAGYRYDTAVLEWEWTDQQTKQARKNHADCAIRQTAGGAPAFCGVDVFSGKFRCQFGEQEGGIRILNVNVSYPGGQPAFALKQPLSFALDIKQRFPIERKAGQQIAKKFLTYDIRDQNGRTIEAVNNDVSEQLKTLPDAVSQYYTLETDGTYRFVIPQQPADASPLGRFKLSEDVLKAYGTAIAAGQIQAVSWPITGTALKAQVTLVDKQGKPATVKRRFVIVFPDFAHNPDDYEVKMLNPDLPETPPTPNPVDGWLGMTTIELGIGKQTGTLENTFTATQKVTIGTGNALNPAPEYMLTIKFSPVRGFSVQPDKKLQLLVENVPSGIAPKNVCDVPAGQQKPLVPWTMYLTIYDADRNGNPTQQVSTDPETSETQQKQVTFNVACTKPEELRPTCAFLGGECKPTAADCKPDQLIKTPQASDCPTMCCRRTPTIITTDVDWLKAFLALLEKEKKSADQLITPLVFPPQDVRTDNTKLGKWLTIMKDTTLKKISDDATAAINEYHRIQNSMTEEQNKKLFEPNTSVGNVLPALGGMSAAADRAQTSFSRMLSTAVYDVPAIEVSITEVKDAIKEANTSYDNAIANLTPLANRNSEYLAAQKSGIELIVTLSDGRKFKFEKLSNENWRHTKTALTSSWTFETLSFQPEYTPTEIVNDYGKETWEFKT